MYPLKKYAWHGSAVQKTNLLFLVLICLLVVTCKGQNPDNQKPRQTSAQDTSISLAKKLTQNELSEAFATFQVKKTNEPGPFNTWSIEYVALHHKSGDVSKTLNATEATYNDELYHLSLPLLKNKDGEVVYDLTKYKTSDAFKDNNSYLKLIDQSVLVRSHRLSIDKPEFTLHVPISKYANSSDGLAYRYIVKRQRIWAIDTLKNKIISHLELIKIMDAKGKVLKAIEEKEAIVFSLSLSDDRRFLMLSDTDVEIGDEWVEHRKPYVLIDLVNNKRYKISIPLNNDNQADGFGFCNQKYFELFHYYYYNSGDWNLHILIDPYTQIIYSKSYRIGEKGIEIPKQIDINTYTFSKF